MDWIVNNIQLIWKLAWMLSTYRTCNSIVRFSKYKFYNKLLLLDGVMLLRVTPGIIWTQAYMYMCVCVWIDDLSFYSGLSSHLFTPPNII